MEHDKSQQQMDLDQQGESIESIDAMHAGIANVMAHLGLRKNIPLPEEPLALSEESASSHPEWSVRVAMVEQLGSSGALLTPLLAALNDEHEAVRVAAIRVLATAGEHVPIESLCAALDDSSWYVRAVAITELGRQKERAPLQAQVNALNDVDETVRAAAAWALGHQGERAPLQPLVAALYDPAWSVREAAACALGECGGASAVGPLLTARLDVDSSVRVAAELALQWGSPEIAASVASVAAESKSTFNVWDVSPSLPVKPDDAALHIHKSYQLEQDSLDEEEVVSTGEQRRSGPLARRKRLFLRPEWFVPRIDIDFEDRQEAQRPEPRKPHIVATLLGRSLVAAILVAILLSWWGIGQVLHPSAGTVAITATQLFTAGTAYEVAWSHDGQYLATAGSSSVQIWNAKSNQQFSVINIGASILAIHWSSSNLQIVAVVSGTALKVMQVKNGTLVPGTRLLTSAPPGTGALLFAWSADEQHLAIARRGEKSVQACNLLTATCLPVSYWGLAGGITALALSSTGKTIALASDDGHSKDKGIQVWNTQMGTLVSPFTDSTYRGVSMTLPIIAIAWSSNDQQFAYATDKQDLALWDSQALESHLTFTPTNTTSSRSIFARAALAWSPNNQYIASAMNGNQVQIWSVISAGPLLAAPYVQKGTVNDITWSPDGKRIASVGMDGTVHIWGIA